MKPNFEQTNIANRFHNSPTSLNVLTLNTMIIQHIYAMYNIL